MPNIPLDIQKKHIETFIKERPKFQEYANKLQEVLQKAADMYAPFGIVQSRAKTVNSFSEKIIRKDKYKEPMRDMTDLCGVRVITHFSKQVIAISRFLEENFEIDWENSLDVKTRLKISEFGYRSIHYILSPKNENVLGIEFSKQLFGLKAEVQVRTFHEHIWADICHDRIYKSSINVSDEWKRESARLAAILEEADNAFAEMSEIIDQLTVNNLPTPKPSIIKNEKEIFKTLIKMQQKIDKNSLKLRLKLAQIHNSNDEWNETILILQPLFNHEAVFDRVSFSDIKREFGYALYNVKNKKEGISLIKQAIGQYNNNPAKQNELALSYSYLAKADKKEALKYLSFAHKYSPDNPYYYAGFLVEQLCSATMAESNTLILLETKIKEIIKQCHYHIELGIEVVKSYAVIGKMHFLQNNFTESINAFLCLLKIVVRDENIFSKSILEDEILIIEKLKNFNFHQSSILSGLLHLVLWFKYGNKNSKVFLEKNKKSNFKSDENVLMVCGNSSFLDKSTENEYNSYIYEALRDFKGNVISGGTSSGIPGIVGRNARLLKEEGKKEFSLIGYLPKSKKTDKGYDGFVLSEADDFSILDVINYWTDILVNNINPKNVFVIGIHGGFISSVEYKLALILGANVCLVSKLGGSAQTLSGNPTWNQMPNLLNVPQDPYTIWALLNQNIKGVLSEKEIQELAPIMHEFYRIKRKQSLNPEKETDINKYRVVMEWDKLSPSLQKSNFKQVAFMEHILKRGMLKLRKSKNPKMFKIPGSYKTLDDMARLEHARWNAERLLEGWKLGPKDVLKKTTPYLLAWDKLDDETKTYDYDPIKLFPELLAKIGYEILEDD